MATCGNCRYASAFVGPIYEWFLGVLDPQDREWLNRGSAEGWLAPAVLVQPGIFVKRKHELGELDPRHPGMKFKFVPIVNQSFRRNRPDPLSFIWTATASAQKVAAVLYVFDGSAEPDQAHVLFVFDGPLTADRGSKMRAIRITLDLNEKGKPWVPRADLGKIRRISGFVGAHGLFQGMKRNTPVLLSRFVVALTGSWVGYEGVPEEEGGEPRKVEAHHGDGNVLHNCWVNVRALPPDIHEKASPRIEAGVKAGDDLIFDHENWLRSSSDPSSSTKLMKDPLAKRRVQFQATIDSNPNFVAAQAAHVRVMIHRGVFGRLGRRSRSPKLSYGLRGVAEQARDSGLLSTSEINLLARYIRRVDAIP